MSDVLSILTKDEKEFISHHGIQPSDIYDGRGEIIRVYHDKAKERGCQFVIANPCPNGHRLKDRSGHCIVCRPMGIAIRKMQAGDRKSHEFEKVKLYHQGEGDDEVLDIKVQKQIVEEAENEDAERKNEEMKDFVERAVAELTPPCDELLRRFYWDRLSGVEIAQAMNYSNADSVKTQKNKCMKKLKPIVEQFRRL